MRERPFELKGQDAVQLMAPSRPVDVSHIARALRGTLYVGEECPACATEPEDAYNITERMSRTERRDRRRLIRQVEEWMQGVEEGK